MLNPLQIPVASTMVRDLRVSISNYFLYTAGNNMALLSIQRFLAGLEELFREFPSVTLGESEGRLVVEATPLDEKTTGSTNMIRDLFLTHKIHSLTFLKGLETEEVKTLFSLMKPKALPTGLSFSQALVQHSLEHLRANEKVFVAVKEGEVVVSAGAVGGSGAGNEQNLQEALEALQYFLQIFARVKPDSNKQEVARKMFDHMGSWLKNEGDEGGGAGSGINGPAQAQAWTEVFGGFMALRNNLATAKLPAQVKEAQVGMEEILRKLVFLGESQGIELKEENPAGPFEAGPIQQTQELPPSTEKTGAGPEPGQGNLFENDPDLAAVQEGKLDVFWDPAREETADRLFARLQELEQLENFEALWNGLWEKIFSGDEKTQALCLRHLNRLQWNQIPRPLQVEAFRHLRKFLAETRRPAVYPIGLSLAQDWIPLELGHPDWDEFLETVRVLRQLAERKPPFFEKQNLAARVALETVFCEPILDSLLKRYQAKGPDGGDIQKLFVLLGSQASNYLYQKIEQEPSDNPGWKKTAELLDALETAGQHVYEFWLEWPEKREYLEKFLDIFKVLPLSGDMEDYFERHWNSFRPEAQAKILDIVEQWERGSFRPFLLRLLEKPESSLAPRALQVLGKIGLEGDATAVVQAVQKYPPHGKEKEAFWIQACQTLGELEDPAGIEALMEWAGKYKLMESRKNRSLEVRRAALEALGRFHTQPVTAFLLGLQKEGEKELAPAIDQALKSSGQG